MEGFLTVVEAAKYKGLSTGHIRQLCIDGKLEGVQKFGRMWSIPITSLDKYTPGPKGFEAYWQHKRKEGDLLLSQIKEIKEKIIHEQ